MEAIVKTWNKSRMAQAYNNFLPIDPPAPGVAIEDEQLYHQQLALSHILETSGSPEAAIAALSSSSLAHSDWHVENCEPYMIDTAMRIAQKWKK